ERTIKSVVNLFIQVAAPFLCIIVPAEIVIISLLPSMPISFEVAQTSFYLLHIHSIVHSAFLIALTPGFRKFICGSFRKSGGTVTIHSLK
ncbi:hypothetical protein PMAYCL1PPCAC_21542, partial [Pristionchus mayeri]